MKVRLEGYEMMAAAVVGIRRHLLSLNSREFNKVKNPRYGWHTDIEAACGELSVAKALGIYWDGSVNTFKRPDLPPDIQVRTSKSYQDHLVIRSADADDERFIKVVGVHPDYELVGWIWGREGKRAEYWGERNGTYPAFWVPHAALRVMETFNGGQHEDKNDQASVLRG